MIQLGQQTQLQPNEEDMAKIPTAPVPEVPRVSEKPQLLHEQVLQDLEKSFKAGVNDGGLSELEYMKAKREIDSLVENNQVNLLIAQHVSGLQGTPLSRLFRWEATSFGATNEAINFWVLIDQKVYRPIPIA